MSTGHPLVIVADENIPCVHEFFGSFGNVKTLPGRNISAADVKEADVLLVRSVTKVNEALLQGSQVKFVGTCTIGVDHLDRDYMAENGISFASAPGCNAGGVVQYALSAMAHLRPEWADKKIGIIGCGNVGGRLYRVLDGLGIDCVGFDPFKDESQISRLVDWETILQCDIICTHTPLTHDGDHPTHHLLNEAALKSLKPGTLLLNAGRGDVIDNKALYELLKQGQDLDVALDVWESEPKVFLPLVPLVKIGTPHIAGYSFEGRLNGSKMIHRSLSEFLSVAESTITEREKAVMGAVLGGSIEIECDAFNSALVATYPLMEDDARFRVAMNAAEPEKEFDILRKTYWRRHEFTQYEAKVTQPLVNSIQTDTAKLKRELSCCGFTVSS